MPGLCGGSADLAPSNKTLIKDDQGLVLGSAAIIREVTARWNQERERQRRLAELEAKLRELSYSGPHVVDLMKRITRAVRRAGADVDEPSCPAP